MAYGMYSKKNWFLNYRHFTLEANVLYQSERNLEALKPVHMKTIRNSYEQG